jgi:hypothetical protein
MIFIELLTQCLRENRLGEEVRNKFKFTKRAIEAISVPGGKDLFVWDNEITGLGCRIFGTGVRSYFIQYRTRQGRSRRLTLGKHGVLTVDQARVLARKRLSEVDEGKDPVQEINTIRSTPDIKALCQRYLDEHAKIHKKASSYRTDNKNIENIIRPRFGSYKVDVITRQDIDKLKHVMHQTPYQFNRVCALLSKMFNLAELLDSVQRQA